MPLLDLVLTGVFFSMDQDREQARTQAKFERQANSYVTATQKGIERNLEVMEAAMNIQMDTNPGTQKEMGGQYEPLVIGGSAV